MQLKRAQQGDVAAFKAIEPWIVGRVPEEVKMTQEHVGPIYLHWEVSEIDASPRN